MIRTAWSSEVKVKVNLGVQTASKLYIRFGGIIVLVQLPSTRQFLVYPRIGFVYVLLVSAAFPFPAELAPCNRAGF